MYVFPVKFRGSRVVGPDGDPIPDIIDYLNHAAQQLDPAAMALNMFEEYKRPTSNFAERRDASTQARARVESRHGPEPWIEKSESKEDWLIRRRTEWIDWELEVKREEWSSGQIPEAYSHAPLTISALAFVYAIDGIGKVLRDMRVHEFHEVVGVELAFHTAFPDVVGLRNSQMHAEERAVRRERGRPIQLQGSETPISTGGAVFISNSFIGNRYLWTLADGSCGEIEISTETVGRAQTLVQQAIDSFNTWEGWPEVHPY